MKPRLPEILDERRDGDRVVLELYVPAELAYFEGHFPGLPVLPGIVQVDWAVKLARGRVEPAGAFRSADNLRFQAIVPPGVPLTLTLELKDGGTRLAFAYASRGRKCSSGILVFDAPR